MSPVVCTGLRQELNDGRETEGAPPPPPCQVRSFQQGARGLQASWLAVLNVPILI